MSKLHDLRTALKAHLVAQAGWAPGDIILQRQGDLWNEIATAMSTAVNGACLVIQSAKGRNPDPDGKLVMELTMRVTLICAEQLQEGQTPEEELWETMVLAVHGKSFHPSGNCIYEFQCMEFDDDVQLADGAGNWLARETVFRVRQNF